jgi:hypothetical protein
MNTVTAALRTAGIQIPPLNKRVWLWLKDHPNKSAKEVANAIGVGVTSVASACSNMSGRGMLIEGQVPSRAPRGSRTVAAYTVKYRDFELLHAPPKNRPIRVLALAPTPQLPLPFQAREPAPVAPPVAPQPPMSDTEFVLSGIKARLENDYSVAQLRAIRVFINKLIGE